MFHVKHRFRHRRRHGSTARSSIHHATSGDSCRGRPGPNAITRNRSSKRWTPSAGTRNHHDDQAISAGGSSILGVPTRNFFALTKGSGRRGCAKACRDRNQAVPERRLKAAIGRRADRNLFNTLKIRQIIARFGGARSVIRQRQWRECPRTRARERMRPGCDKRGGPQYLPLARRSRRRRSIRGPPSLFPGCRVTPAIDMPRPARVSPCRNGPGTSPACGAFPPPPALPVRGYDCGRLDGGGSTAGPAPAVPAQPAARRWLGTDFPGSKNGTAAVFPMAVPSSVQTSSALPGAASSMGTQT